MIHSNLRRITKWFPERGFGFVGNLFVHVYDIAPYLPKNIDLTGQFIHVVEMGTDEKGRKKITAAALTIPGVDWHSVDRPDKREADPRKKKELQCIVLGKLALMLVPETEWHQKSLNALEGKLRGDKFPGTPDFIMNAAMGAAVCHDEREYLYRAVLSAIETSHDAMTSAHGSNLNSAIHNLSLTMAYLEGLPGDNLQEWYKKLDHKKEIIHQFLNG